MLHILDVTCNCANLVYIIFCIILLDYCLYPGSCDLVMDLWHVNKWNEKKKWNSCLSLHITVLLVIYITHTNVQKDNLDQSTADKAYMNCLSLYEVTFSSIRFWALCSIWCSKEHKQYASHPFTWGRKQIQFPKCCVCVCSFEYQVMDKVQKLSNSAAINYFY
jgi:hypothetical protein